MKLYLIAHDLGTSGNKATLYTIKGQLIASTIETYGTNMKRTGYAEQNPLDWWKAVCNSTRKLMEGRDKTAVAGISFSGQMMGCVCLDAEGRLLKDSMIWADTRASKETEKLIEKLGMEEICAITGMRPAPNYTVEKAMWIKNHEPSVFQNTAVILQAKDYIIYRMTGELVTDRTDASATQAYDIRTNQWSDKILKAADISADLFPKVFESATVVGELREIPAEEMGLCKGIPVVAGGGDGLCAAVGAGSVAAGKGYCCLGSSSWVSCSTKKVFDNREGTIMFGPHVVDQSYVLSGTMQTGTLSYNWMKEKLYPNIGFDEVNEKIQHTEVGSNGVIFLPYLLGERSPWWNASVRGSYLGLSMDTKPEDMMRAVVEGVGLNLGIIFDEITKHEPIYEINAIGGGAKAQIWRQVLADIFNVPVYKMAASDEGSSFGAIVIAGVALGIFEDYNSVLNLIQRESCCEPDAMNHKIYCELKERFKEAYKITSQFYGA